MSRPRRLPLALLAVASSFAVLGAGTAAALPTPPKSAQPQKTVPGETFRLASVISGLASPTWIGHAPGDADGLWVAQQGGQLLRVQGKTATVRLSIAGRIASDGERGLLGVAFLPGFATNRLVALNSTNQQGNTRVELWRLGRSAGRRAARSHAAESDAALPQPQRRRHRVRREPAVRRDG